MMLSMRRLDGSVHLAGDQKSMDPLAMATDGRSQILSSFAYPFLGILGYRDDLQGFGSHVETRLGFRSGL